MRKIENIVLEDFEYGYLVWKRKVVFEDGSYWNDWHDVKLLPLESCCPENHREQFFKWVKKFYPELENEVNEENVMIIRSCPGSAIGMESPFKKGYIVQGHGKFKKIKRK